MHLDRWRVLGLCAALAGCGGGATTAADAAPHDARPVADAWPFPVSDLAKIDVTADDLVFDPARRVLYASLSGEAEAASGSVAVIDPEAARVTRTFSVGGTPGPLALSDDGQFLYAGLRSSGAIDRILPDSGTVSTVVAAHRHEPNGERVEAAAIAVMPGEPHGFVVSWRFAPPDGLWPVDLAVYTDGTRRPSTGASGVDAYQLVFTSPTTMLAFGGRSYELTVDGGGLHELRELSIPFDVATGALRHDRGLLVAPDGSAFDVATTRRAGRFDASGAIAISPDGVRVTFLGITRGVPDTSRDGFDVATITVFDRATFLPIATRMVATYAVISPPRELVQWSEDGFAVRDADAIRLVRVPSTAP